LRESTKNARVFATRDRRELISAYLRVVILIDEHIRADGVLVHTHLDRDGDHVVVISDDCRGRLSVGALDKVMRRYGRPLEDGLTPTGNSLDLGGGHVITAFRFHAVVDAEARDYLAWTSPGAETVAALSNGVAAALRYLVLRLAEGA
jgi:hypothetical protein